MEKIERALQKEQGIASQLRDQLKKVNKVNTTKQDQHGISVSTSSHGRDIWTHIIFEFLPGNCLSCQPKLCHKIFCKNPIQSSLGPLNTLVQSDAFDAEFAQRCQLTFHTKATLPRIKLSALLYFRQYSFHAVMLFNATKSENTSGNITLTQC